MKYIIPMGCQQRQLASLLMTRIEKSIVIDPHPGLIVCSHTYREPFPSFSSIDFLITCVMDLLLEYAYPRLGKDSYAKFIIIVSMKVSDKDDIGFSLGSAIVLTLEDGSLIPKGNVYSSIQSLVLSHADKYENFRVTAVTLKIFIEGKV
ncbi:orf148 (mitochondrion) [Beta vulgaris subsp. vulgaris]|uniref:Orf148 protein n=3 Tax=Beta TaxID=3554 RepID=Q9MDV5_BETVV|nr:orf148 [Beta vulgaris subsp. vulgaris]NP_064111.1 orf148 [Beta vulgaris subsp. vulgaris]YP_004222299.1 hypothetical protein LKY74_mgp104 [Beta vulgaris subsp. maritima]YP_004222353.1 hypothetical protein LKY74_mgp045 [Beta vulgaris subsp. maritima]YP_004842104.1 hypothetical protein LKY79_mgp104 [Beta macrocarpa]YP_004842158.1 hypothetical protein LKY79_mgp047 [Beta macrocarpa]CBJ13998.1 hypothetical protein [Beta vulgaris subsp. maritima]CBJ14034.1 hypothetical protein [Beta vulgaris sub